MVFAKSKIFQAQVKYINQIENKIHVQIINPQKEVMGKNRKDIWVYSTILWIFLSKFITVLQTIRIFISILRNPNTKPTQTDRRIYKQTLTKADRERQTFSLLSK